MNKSYKKSGFTSWHRIFAFTFTQNTKAKGWRLTTLIIALILLFGISGSMLIYEVVQKSKEAITETAITDVFVVDHTEENAVYNYLNMVGDKVYNKINYTTVHDTKDAVDKAGKTDIILDIAYNGSQYNIYIIIPKETDIGRKDAKAFKDFISTWFSYILVQKSGINISAISELTTPVTTSTFTGGENDDKGLNSVKEAMSFILPYLTVILIYCLVLIYGQGVAGSAIMEKNSKLMDFFLISVKPSSMMLGKTLAIAFAGLLQMLAWVAGIVGGCFIGASLVRLYNPGTTMPLLRFFDALGQASGMLSAGPVALAIAIVVAGFLLYCSISAIGGALASKPEDLGATNMLFTLILLASFFSALYGGGFTSGSVSAGDWMNYVPFTAVLMTPARLIMGNLSVVQGFISLALTVVLMLLAIILAGKVYTMTTFWRGKPPKIGTVFEMMKNKKGQA